MFVNIVMVMVVCYPISEWEVSFNSEWFVGNSLNTTTSFAYFRKMNLDLFQLNKYDRCDLTLIIKLDWQYRKQMCTNLEENQKLTIPCAKTKGFSQNFDHVTNESRFRSRLFCSQWTIIRRYDEKSYIQLISILTMNFISTPEARVWNMLSWIDGFPSMSKLIPG